MVHQEQISRVLAGDAEAAQQLAEDALAFLMRYFLTTWRLPMDQAEEFTQEAFAEVWSSMQGFSGGSWRSWLGTIARRVAWKKLNYKAPTTSISALDESSDWEEVPLYDNDVRSQQEQTAMRQEWAMLQELIEQLRQEYQEILFLYYMEELSTEEVSLAMDIPVGTVKIWLYRARNELKSKWERINETTSKKRHNKQKAMR